MFALVVLGHLAAGWFLAKSMRPPVLSAPAADEVVMYLEFLPPPPDVPDAPVAHEPTTEPEVPVTAPERSPPARTVRSEPPSMQAIFVPAAPEAETPVESPREFVAPERDPFHRPAAPANDHFRRTPPAAIGNPNLPRIAGGRPVEAPLPELKVREFGAKEAIQTAALLLGLGGENAPIEAPCAGRVSAGLAGTSAFSPNWRRDYGCGDEKDSAGFTGKVELPPGTAR